MHSLAPEVLSKNIFLDNHFSAQTTDIPFILGANLLRLSIMNETWPPFERFNFTSTTIPHGGDNAPPPYPKRPQMLDEAQNSADVIDVV